MIPDKWPPNQQDALQYHGHAIDVLVAFDAEGEPVNHYVSEGFMELSLKMIQRRLDEKDAEEAKRES